MTTKYEVGDIVQISPECQHTMFAACFLTVSEPKPWGVMGYVQALGQDEKMGGQAYIRLPFDQISKPLGKAEWMAV